VHGSCARAVRFYTVSRLVGEYEIKGADLRNELRHYYEERAHVLAPDRKRSSPTSIRRSRRACSWSRIGAKIPALGAECWKGLRCCRRGFHLRIDRVSPITEALLNILLSAFTCGHCPSMSVAPFHTIRSRARCQQPEDSESDRFLYSRPVEECRASSETSYRHDVCGRSKFRRHNLMTRTRFVRHCARLRPR